MTKLVWILFCLSVLLADAVAGPGGPPGGGSAAEPPTPVETAVVTVAPRQDELRVVGSLLAAESVTLRPEVAGRVQTIHFAEGEPVEQGQALVTLDPDEPRAVVAASEAAARLWELKFARARDLAGKAVMSQQEYDEIQATLKEAQARLALERVRLDKTIIRAPFAGVVGLRRVSPGDYVEAGQDLANLEVVDPIKVDFSVPERHASLVRPGLAIAVTVESFPGRTFAGELYAIDPRLDESARALRLRGRLPNADGVLRPGMFARVALTLGEAGAGLWVPEEALTPRGGDQFVFRVRDGQAALTRVDIGMRRPGQVEIRGGLDQGDVVVTAGQLRLRDGAAVQAVGGPPPAP